MFAIGDRYELRGRYELRKVSLCIHLLQSVGSEVKNCMNFVCQRNDLQSLIGTAVYPCRAVSGHGIPTLNPNDFLASRMRSELAILYRELNNKLRVLLVKILWCFNKLKFSVHFGGHV
jgi:hypothetical protein